MNATVSFTPPTVTITGPKTQNLTLTLSSAAPTGGVTVSVSSSNTLVATTPATVTFAAGATTANVPVTALTLGTTVIHANATIFIPDATANVTVVTGGPIGVPAPVSVGLGGSGPFTVTLPVASANPVTVTLTSTDTTKVTVTSTVTIPAGQTTPASQPVVTGINVGSANISVSAPGYTTASQTVTVGATVSWPAALIPFTGLGGQNVTLTLSGNAPAAGLTVNLSSEQHGGSHGTPDRNILTRHENRDCGGDGPQRRLQRTACERCEYSRCRCHRDGDGGDPGQVHDHRRHRR